MTFLDTGILVGALLEKHPEHAACREALEEFDAPFTVRPRRTGVGNPHTVTLPPKCKRDNCEKRIPTRIGGAT